MDGGGSGASANPNQVGKEEVKLCRTISQKQDDYYLDAKHVTKQEVMNLLESAGFSQSNPYYVVQPGKIASLTLMNDYERLDLLKEIGGTYVFEERRRESLKILQETGNKRKQIDQVVHYLEGRLKELDEEKKELIKYQQLDKQRRSLECTIFDKEVNDARQKLVEEEAARQLESLTKEIEESINELNTIRPLHQAKLTVEDEIKKGYKQKGIKELQKILSECNEQLKQFGHVNKKALDQYVNFTEQREQLRNRRVELGAGDQKIRELISVLDQRRDESIERTFKGVARHFLEIFSELVQSGHGYLVMMKKKWGAAYCVRGGTEREKMAMQYLERRECEYDLKSSVDFYKEGDSVNPAVTGVLVFTSTPDKESNKYYLGPAPLDEMARQIATATGPCGNNRDYLFLLEKAMFDIGHEDDYVIELANEVRKVLFKLKEMKMAAVHISLKSHLSFVRLATLPDSTVVESR